MARLEPKDATGAGANLTHRTVRGLSWMFAGAGSQAILRIVVLAILSRLLTPAEFGVVSAALTVVAIAEIFGQIGVAPAVVQLSNLTNADMRTAQTLSVLLGFATAITVATLAPDVARVFRIPEMEPVLQALSLVFVIRGFSIVSEATMQRGMRFRGVAGITMASYALGYGVIAIALALLGYGVWAIVGGYLAQTLLSTALFIAWAPLSMRPAMNIAAVRRLVAFGFGMTLTSFANVLALNIDQFIVGRWLGAATLGFYNRAYTILVQPANLFGAVGDKVLFPAFASIQNDHKRLARAYTQAVGLIAATTLPLSLFLLLFAEELVLLLLGGQWSGVVAPFQILVTSLFFRTAYKMTSALLRACGRVYLLAAWQWLYAVMLALCAWAGLTWGLAGVSAGVALAIVATFETGLLCARMACGVEVGAIHATILRHALLAIVIALPGAAIKLLHPVQWPLGELMLASCGAALLAATLWWLMPTAFGAEGRWLSELARKTLKRPRAA